MFKSFHWKLFFVTLAIGCGGLLTIYSTDLNTSGQYAFKQALWLGVAVLSMFVVYAVGYRPFLNASTLLYISSLLLLGLVVTAGVIRGGAQSWFSFGGVALQPSEFTKIATILCLAATLGQRKYLAERKRGLFLAFFLTIIPLILIVKQPDLGTAIVFIPILFCILFIWGARWKHLLSVTALGLSALPFLWFSLREYQRRRILVFLNPNIDPLNSGYTAIQSKIAVGSGGLSGKGFLGGTQHTLAFLPEDHTDFIFGVLAEEWGFLGSLLLIFLYGILLWQMFSILNRTTDLRARLLGAGIISMFGFHIFINIGMTIGLMPITGLPLPLMSYGGSSLVSFFMAIGFMLSIYKERSIF